MTSPQVAAAAASNRTEAEARAERMTKDDLARLLREKISAQTAYSAAASMCRNAPAEMPEYGRIMLDIREREALKASVAADEAYRVALDAFIEQEAA